MLPFKFPRTPHFPWSHKSSSDDILKTVPFQGREVVATRKMDGESFTGHATGSHARSPDSRYHPSRDWSRNWWAQRMWKLPPGWRVSCENLYAQHSIAYTDLPSYVLGFGAWDDTLTYLSWDDTTALMASLDIEMVDVLWRGIWDERAVRALYKDGDENTHEGYVVRVTDAFSIDAFGDNVRKYVRPNHVQTDTHWMHKEVVPNKLKDGS